jgi:DNA-binding MarR family transcriptional regulator
MNSQEIRTLRILEAIDQEHQPSQRDMARKLGISLGLVNSFIKRLAQKGYFKVSTIPKNRVRYILTPKGAAEKTRLTYAYIHHSYQYYKEGRQKLRHLFRHFVDQGIRRVVFYGAGDLAEIAFLSLQETDIHLAAVVDDQKAGKRFFSHTIQSPDFLKIATFDRLMVTTLSAQSEVMEKLSDMDLPKHQIVTIN